MDKTEWNRSVDLRGEYDSADSIELTQPVPILENLIEKIELPEQGRLPDAEAVISKVVEVAESNNTIERILERKHEVKDFPAKETQKQQFAARVSEVIGEAPISRGMVASQANTHSIKQKSSFTSLATSNTLYGYAIRYGFLSAILALIIAVLIVVLFT